MSKGLFELTKEQKRAFNRLRKAYSDCEKLGVLFYNNHGRLGAVDNAKIVNYNDEASGILDRGQNCDNEFMVVDSWDDDLHYFHVKN